MPLSRAALSCLQFGAYLSAYFMSLALIASRPALKTAQRIASVLLFTAFRNIDATPGNGGNILLLAATLIVEVQRVTGSGLD